MSNRIVKILQAGKLDYGTGLRLQKIIADLHHSSSKNKETETCNTLVLLEHNPVYTIGIRRKDYSKEDEEKLVKLGAQFFRTNRGGLITFHGPGQLIAYPILNLKDFQSSVRWYVSEMENMIIRLCAEFGIKGETSPDTGVWVDNNKICAIGIHGSRYITTHGLALNCNTDLKWFDHIVPCGIKGKGVTSISQELKFDVTTDDVIPILRHAFKDQFQCSLVDCTLNETSQFLRNAAVPE